MQLFSNELAWERAKVHPGSKSKGYLIMPYFLMTCLPPFMDFSLMQLAHWNRSELLNNLLHTPTPRCNFYFLFLCSVRRWLTGRAPNLSMNFLPRILTAMRCLWKNTGIFWVMLFIPIIATVVLHKMLCSTCYVFLPSTCPGDTCASL